MTNKSKKPATNEMKTNNEEAEKDVEVNETEMETESQKKTQSRKTGTRVSKKAEETSPKTIDFSLEIDMKKATATREFLKVTKQYDTFLQKTMIDLKRQEEEAQELIKEYEERIKALKNKLKENQKSQSDLSKMTESNRSTYSKLAEKNPKKKNDEKTSSTAFNTPCHITKEFAEYLNTIPMRCREDPAREGILKVIVTNPTWESLDITKNFDDKTLYPRSLPATLIKRWANQTNGNGTKEMDEKCMGILKGDDTQEMLTNSEAEKLAGSKGEKSSVNKTLIDPDDHLKRLIMKNISENKKVVKENDGSYKTSYEKNGSRGHVITADGKFVKNRIETALSHLFVAKDDE